MLGEVSKKEADSHPNLFRTWVSKPSVLGRNHIYKISIWIIIFEGLPFGFTVVNMVSQNLLGLSYVERVRIPLYSLVFSLMNEEALSNLAEPHKSLILHPQDQ